MELILFLIISGVFWFISQKFGDQIEPPTGPTQPRRPTAQSPSPQQPRNDPAQNMSQDERTRRIQEEIRRKIAARRGQSPGQGLPVPTAEPTPPLMPWEDPNHQLAWEVEEAPQPQPGYPQPTPSAYSKPLEPAHTTKKLDYGRRSDAGPMQRDVFDQVYGGAQPGSPYYEAPPPVRDYEAELAEKRREVEQSVRRAAEARKRARSQIESATGQPVGPSGSRRSFSGLPLARQVKARLKDPESTREAFLLMEILGTPVGQRVNGNIGRSWES